MKFKVGDRVVGVLNKTLGTVQAISGALESISVQFDGFEYSYWNEESLLIKIVDGNDIMKELINLL